MAEHLTSTISGILVQAMRSLALSYPDFGRSKKGESRFQEELQHVLENQPALQSQREQRIQSSRFLNDRVIIPDHLVIHRGVKFAIELKYVCHPGGGGQPANPQGFPYDVIKDCAKVETLIDDVSSAAADIQDGIVIGLTDFDFWTSFERDWWSKNYLLHEYHDWKRIGAPRLFKTVTTKRRSCIHPGVIFNKRFHVGLAHNWEYRWFDYNDRFRFVMLRRGVSQPTSNKASSALWPELTTLPFRDAEHRRAAVNHKALFDESYEKNGRECPVCKPGAGLNFPPFED